MVEKPEVFYEKQLRHIVIEVVNGHLSIDEMVEYFQSMLLGAYDSGYNKGVAQRVDNVRLVASKRY